MSTVKAVCWTILAFLYCNSFLTLAQECTPPCRTGYFCSKGNCVSECNPPCDAGFRCDTVKHDCVPIQDAGTASAETGWGRGAGISGFILSPVILGLDIASAITRGQTNNMVPALPLAACSQLVTEISIPIVAGGGSSSRHGRAKGILGLRIGGWISYGVSSALFISMAGLGIGANEPPPPALILVDGIISASSCLMLSEDAIVSNSQANSYNQKADSQDSSLLYLSLGSTKQGDLKVSLSYAF